jgi:hypothetical protein
MSIEESTKWFDSMKKHAEAIKENALRISWYMRGGISYNDVLNLSPFEKNVINKIIDENIEATKNSGMPII